MCDSTPPVRPLFPSVYHKTDILALAGMRPHTHTQRYRMWMSTPMRTWIQNHTISICQVSV